MCVNQRNGYRILKSKVYIHGLNANTVLENIKQTKQTHASRTTNFCRMVAHFVKPMKPLGLRRSFDFTSISKANQSKLMRITHLMNVSNVTLEWCAVWTLKMSAWMFSDGFWTFNDSFDPFEAIQTANIFKNV